MKINKRGILTAILAILCTIALALGVGLMLPKHEKINANAAIISTADVTFADFVVTNSVGTTVVDRSPVWFQLRESAYDNTKGSATRRFSVALSVPAYTQYTVSYAIGTYIGLSFATTGGDFATAEVWINRYSDSSYGTPTASNLGFKQLLRASAAGAVSSVANINNLIFENNTNTTKVCKAYLDFNFNVSAKSGSAQVVGEIELSSYNIVATDLAVPKTNDTLTCNYDGNQHTVNFTYADEVKSTDFDGIMHAYNVGYDNVNVTVDAVDGNGNTTSNFTTTPASLTTATGSGSITATLVGTYTVRFNLTSSAISNGIEWVGGGTGEKTIVLTITKKESTVTPIIGTGPFYANNDLYKDVSIKTTDGDTPGIISWDEGQTLKAGTNNYTWTFTPTDSNNYSNKTGTESITVEAIEIKEIKVKFTQGTAKFYTSNKPDDLKVKLGVFKVYNDGTEIAIAAEDYELDGDLSTAGTVNVKVIYTSTVTEKPALEEFYGDFNVEITEVQLKSITATFNPAGDIYLSSSLDDLKDGLTVTGTYNDGSTAPIKDYALSTPGGGLSLGNVTVTVTPDDDSSITTTFTVNVVADPVVIELKIPEVNDLTYTGETFDVLSEIGNLSATEITTYLDVSGTVSGKLAGEYTVKFKIKDEYIGSVKWENQTATPARYSLTAKSLTSAELSADGTTVELKWNIKKAKVAAVWDTEKSIWVPASSPLAETTESNFLTQVYTNSDGREFTSIDKLAGGVTYQVTARINPLYASNIELDEGTQNLMDSGDEAYTYTPEYVPTIWERVVQFLKANWLWILIAVAALILLIIIIAVAVKRSKTKEERAEKKAAEKERKEEEKRRREEEQRRREEERQAQKEKLEAERELAKAKQEAELEKLRAQAGMAAGAGMASMAMQQPVQQAMPAPQQPVQQQMPQQMPTPTYGSAPMQSDFVKMFYESEIFRLRQELQSRGGGSLSAPNNYEDARLMLAEERARTAESRLAEERARAAEEKSYRSMEERAMLAEERYIRGGGAMPVTSVKQFEQPPAAMGANPEFIGAVIASALRNSGVLPATADTAQSNDDIKVVDEKAVPGTPTMYPSDAVITTTTTVDTTKAKPVMRTREEDTNFDVDGFYDKFE